METTKISQTTTSFGPETFYEDPNMSMVFWKDLNVIDCYQKTNSEKAFKDLLRRYEGLIIRQTNYIYQHMPAAQMGYEWEDVYSEMLLAFVKAIRYINVEYKREHGLESSLGTVFERYSTSWRNSVLSYWNNKKRSAGNPIKKTIVNGKEFRFETDSESYASQNPGLLHTQYIGDYQVLAEKGGKSVLLDREELIERELENVLSKDEMDLFNMLRDKVSRSKIIERFTDSGMERLRKSLKSKIAQVIESLDFSVA
jgi:hypothetical protein